MEPLRIGVLGAARIAAAAIVEPARLTGARLVAIAARDQVRATAFATEHDVERVLDSYADVLTDPEVEAIYNPLAQRTARTVEPRGGRGGQARAHREALGQ